MEMKWHKHEMEVMLCKKQKQNAWKILNGDSDNTVLRLSVSNVLYPVKWYSVNAFPATRDGDRERETDSYNYDIANTRLCWSVVEIS